MRADIELIQLRRFLAIVECGTFVDAAEMLNISQQGLSSSIAKLEDTIGVKLFDRTRGGRLSLTAFGRLLVARGRAQLVMADRMMSELTLLRDARGGSITVGISETMTGRHVAAAILRFHRQQPDVQIRLVEGYTGVMIEGMLAGEVDFVVGSPTADPHIRSELNFRHLFEIRDVLAVRRTHPLSGRTKLKLADLLDYTWMVPAFRGDVYEAIQLACMRAKLRAPRQIIRSDAIVLGTWLCLDDDIIITVSPDMIGAMVDLGGLVTLDVEDTTIVRHACAITRVDVKLSGSASRLLEEIIFEAGRAHGTMAS